MALVRRRGEDVGGTRQQMREKIFAIGDDFWIEKVAEVSKGWFRGATPKG